MKIEPIEEFDENHDPFMPIVTNVRSLQPKNESLKLIREAIEEVNEILAEKFKKESESELTQTNSFQKPSLLLTTLAVVQMKGRFQNYLNFVVS